MFMEKCYMYFIKSFNIVMSYTLLYTWNWIYYQQDFFSKLCCVSYACNKLPGIRHSNSEPILATELNLPGFPSCSSQMNSLLVIMFTETPYNYLGRKKISTLVKFSYKVENCPFNIWMNFGRDCTETTVCFW